MSEYNPTPETIGDSSIIPSSLPAPAPALAYLEERALADQCIFCELTSPRQLTVQHAVLLDFVKDPRYFDPSTTTLPVLTTLPSEALRDSSHYDRITLHTCRTQAHCPLTGRFNAFNTFVNKQAKKAPTSPTPTQRGSGTFPGTPSHNPRTTTKADRVVGKQCADLLGQCSRNYVFGVGERFDYCIGLYTDMSPAYKRAIVAFFFLFL
jgi:hypothetical protein